MMKKIVFFASLSMVSLIICCSSNDSNSDESQIIGSWSERTPQITYTIDSISGVAVDSMLWQAIFHFGQNGEYTAENEVPFGLFTKMGTWSYNGSAGAIDFVQTFPDSLSFEPQSQNHKWEIMVISDTELIVDHIAEFYLNSTDTIISQTTREFDRL